VTSTHCCVTSPRITENTCHVIPSHCCVTSPRNRCISTVHARTRRKHFHSIVAWRLCWNVYNGLLPSNSLSKSVTVYILLCITMWRNCIEPFKFNPYCHIVSLRFILVLSFHLHLGIQTVFPPDFLTKIYGFLISSMRAVCVAHPSYLNSLT
jgi:hypothetical protein